VLHRVTLIGDIPVGPDGRESDLVAGEAFRSIPPVPFPWDHSLLSHGNE
jgi:hypothetical protein